MSKTIKSCRYGLLLLLTSTVWAQEPVRAVATYSILGDFVENVGGDLVDLTVLVGRDGDAHEYEPTPQDSVAIADAGLIFENGLEFESWLEELYQASGSGAKRVVVTEGIVPRPMTEFGDHAHEEEAHGEDQAEGETHAEGEDHAHEEVEVSDLTSWAGSYNITTLTSEAFSPEAMQSVFEAIVQSTPELTLEQVETSYVEMGNTSFTSMSVEGQRVTFTTPEGEVSCDYTFARTEELADYPGSFWHLFEATQLEGAEDCGDYRYLVMGLPHASEPGATPHFHFRYGATEDVTTSAELKNWYPSAYPAETTPESIIQGYQTNARGLGTFLARVAGVEIALTEEEQMAQAGTDEHSEEHSEGEEHADGEDHAHGEFDPHVWHNPQLVMTMVDNIAAALAEADPANEAIYMANATTYKAELEQLDADIQALVDGLPAEERKLITSHDSLGYFAYRYGFEVVGAVIPSVTTESSDANAGELAELVDTIQASSVPAIFVENITNAELVEQVASSAGVTVAPALYTDALGEEGSEGATYLDMMRYNARTIVEALNQ
jgi:ABC-type Zn uptake system ZnuABC Zn-binding protein ZnuA